MITLTQQKMDRLHAIFRMAGKSEIFASTGGESDGQIREETAETLELEVTETVEEGPESLTAEPNYKTSVVFRQKKSKRKKQKGQQQVILHNMEERSSGPSDGKKARS